MKLEWRFRDLLWSNVNNQRKSLHCLRWAMETFKVLIQDVVNSHLPSKKALWQLQTNSPCELLFLGTDEIRKHHWCGLWPPGLTFRWREMDTEVNTHMFDLSQPLLCREIKQSKGVRNKEGKTPNQREQLSGPSKDDFNRWSSLGTKKKRVCGRKREQTFTIVILQREQGIEFKMNVLSLVIILIDRTHQTFTMCQTTCFHTCPFSISVGSNYYCLHFTDEKVRFQELK